MNGYGHDSLSELERRRWQQAYDAGQEDAFTRLFGPEKIPEQLGQFLGWFVIRKVMAGGKFLRACGTVTKKLGKRLEANGYVDAGEAADMVERGSEAGDELPKAEKLAELLYDLTRDLPRFDPDSIPSRTSSGSTASSPVRSGSTAVLVREGVGRRRATSPAPAGP